MKEQENSISSEKQLKNTTLKQPYEKPRLGTVTLFADQVMGNCKVPGPSSGCNVPVQS
ncbi:MAG: hypothetical protein WBM35_00130 [Candidatus Electrothrix sp.]